MLHTHRKKKTIKNHYVYCSIVSLHGVQNKSKQQQKKWLSQKEFEITRFFFKSFWRQKLYRNPDIEPPVVIRLFPFEIPPIGNTSIYASHTAQCKQYTQSVRIKW